MSVELWKHLRTLIKVDIKLWTFIFSGLWSSRVKCSSPWEAVEWTFGSKLRKVVSVFSYCKILSQTGYCCYGHHDYWCYLPVLRTCKIMKWLWFTACISITLCQMCRIVGSHTRALTKWVIHRATSITLPY
jgi:hypothetical protein